MIKKARLLAIASAFLGIVIFVIGMADWRINADFEVMDTEAYYISAFIVFVGCAFLLLAVGIWRNR